MGDIFYSSNRRVSILIFFVLLFCIQSFAQDPIDEYEGIPLVIYPHRSTFDFQLGDYGKIEEMGVFAVVAPDVDSLAVDSLKAHNLIIIPQQIWHEVKRDIIKYTDAHYTLWEAEGTDPDEGNATLEYDTEYTSYFNVNGIEGRKAGGTIPANQELIFGPGYPQNIYYRYEFEGLSTITYNASFRLKIDTTSSPPPGYLNDVVCTLKVTATNTTGTSEYPVTPAKEVTVSDLGGWNSWIDIHVDDDGYNLTDLDNDYLQKNIEQWKEPPDYNAAYMEFKVIWAGLDYLDLYIDHIIVSDEKGEDIVLDPVTQNKILTQIKEDYVDDPAVIGWYALDEPSSIDNYEPFRVVDNILQAYISDLRLHAGFTGGWNGKFGNNLTTLSTGAQNLYEDEEFWLRAKPKNIQINMYNYHYPYTPWIGHDRYNVQWQTKNIEYVTDVYLSRINEYDSSFAFSTQAGAYYEFTNCTITDSLIIPTPTQVLYHTNLGLLYGAKELRCDPFFSDEREGCTGKYRTAGLIDKNGIRTANFYFFKNTLIPRLDGLFGKTLKNSQQTYQQPEYDATSPVVLYGLDTKLDYISADLSEQESGTSVVDIGLFADNSITDKDYFMILNRYYSEIEYFDIYLRSLSEYDNWNVKNYIDTTSFTVEPNGSGRVSFEDTIDAGDAILYSVLPVVKHGGELTTNDTINSSISLSDKMIIKTGSELLINDGYTYTAKDTVTLQGTGFIKGKGYFDLTGNGGIVVASWDRALFKGKSGDHPELIWGEHPTVSNVQYYKIYRFKESVQYILIDSVAGSVTQYVDTNTTIITGTPSGGYTYAQYYVTAKYVAGKIGVESSPSDTIRYAQVEGLLPQKMSVGPAEERFTYNLEQNYPNPFNPNTSISYSLKNDGMVTIKIFDILGAEVKTLVNENKSAGNHKIEFNASKLPSGVYIYRMETSDFISVKKMILLK